jgi:hypothetical protein
MANKNEGEVVSPRLGLTTVLMMSDVEQATSEAAVLEAMSGDVTATGNPMGALSLRIGPTGVVEHIRWLLSSLSKRHRWRAPASKLFPQAPQGAHIGGDILLEEYVFYPGGWTSKWQSAKDLNVTFYKTRSGSDTFTGQEVKEWGEPDFSLRVSIILEKQLGRATLVTHALPRKVEELTKYPGWADEGRAYPSLVLHGGEMRLGPIATRNVGLALTPYVWSVEGDMPPFNPREVRRVVRHFMEEPTLTRTAQSPRQLAAWVRGPESADISVNSQPWTWPGLEEEYDEYDGEDEEDGNII